PVYQSSAQKSSQTCNTIAKEKVSERNEGIALEVRIYSSNNCHDIPIAHQALNIFFCLPRETNVHTDNLHLLLTQAWKVLFDQLGNLCCTAKPRQTNRENHPRTCNCSGLRILLMVSIRHHVS